MRTEGGEAFANSRLAALTVALIATINLLYGVGSGIVTQDWFANPLTVNAFKAVILK